VSYAIYVGRDRTTGGVGYLAGYGDEPSSHWLEVVPRGEHAPDATIEVGVTSAADLPGIRTRIPQAPSTARHVRVSYSYYKGTPGPLTNGGLNEHGVAVRDVWSPSRPELVAMTPPDQSGPNYSDLSRIVLERARTAREGVDLIGRLIAQHGHCTYGGNSHLIADGTEAWVVIQFAGGAGLWAAERLGPDAIRVSRPGYIGEVPAGGDGGRDLLASANFFTFAAEQGWHREGTAFDVNAVYGDGKGRWAGVAAVEDELLRLSRHSGGVTLHDVMSVLRDGRFTGDSAGYGQVVPLHGPLAPELRMIWHAHVGPVTAPFTPVPLALGDVPAEFRQHRYLSAGEAEVFVDRRRTESRSAVPQGIEATRSATAIFKRLQYLALLHPEILLPEVQAIWRAEERRLEADYGIAERLAALALRAGEPELACRHLTYFAANELLRSLDTASHLAVSLELRARLLHGLPDRPEPSGPEQVW
jgi:dipeptidase